jgi:hypothetical protein
MKLKRSGAMQYKTGRPKGFADWKPQRETQQVLRQVQEVLAQYRKHWPLTIRQIFYRLVGVYEYEKTERGYSRLIDYMGRARRSKMIPMEAIRDDGTSRTDNKGWYDQDHFIRAIVNEAETYERDKQARQATRVMILVEAAGMLPQIVKAVGLYGLPVISSSGFDSLTMKYELAQEIIEDGRPTVVLHIGDLDPSGVCIFDSIQADVEAFVGDTQGLLFKRIALTPKQVVLYDLPTSPPKATDKRGEGIIETCQAEALPPDTLAEIVKEAVQEYVDDGQYALDKYIEEQERAHLIEKLQTLAA